jgi:hypothetical protein
MKLNPEQQNDLKVLIPTRFKKALDFQAPNFVKFNEYYKLYRGVFDQGEQAYRGRANLFVPYVYATIETIMPRLVGSRPKVQAIPREPKDIPQADVVTKLLEYQWDMMDMKSKLKDWVRQALMYGVGVVKLTWSFKGQFGQVEEDQPKAEIVDLFDFFIDPDASSLETADYVIHRTYRHLNELKDNPNYNVPRELEAQVTSDQYKVQRDAIMGLSKPNDKDKKKVELLEYWGKYDINRDGIDEECLIVMANRTHVIRVEENPYDHSKKPFIAIQDTQLPQEFWAIGEIEPLSSLQYELNDVRNQRMDNVTLILNRMWKVAKGADVDEADLVSQAGGIVHAGDINGIEVIETPDVTSSAYNEETLIKNDMQQASGVTDYTKGMGGSNVRGQQGMGNETATGIMLLQEAGNARFRYKLDNIEDALREFGKQLISLDQQFIDTQQVVRIVGESGIQWKTVAPKEIKGEFDIVVEAGSTQPMNKSVRRAEARELLATVAPFAQMGVNINYFLKYLLQTYDLADINEAFTQNPAMGGLPPEVAEQAGGPQGAIFGGNVGNRGNVPLQTLAQPQAPDRNQDLLSQAAAG